MVNKFLIDDEPTPAFRDAGFSQGNAQTIPEHTGIKPLHVSTFTGYERGREEFIRGAELLGLNTERKPLLPQQYVVADVLQACDEDGAPIHVINSFCIPRRATKTTTVWAVALGRITNPERDAYQVGFTAQTGVKARQRFVKDVVEPLQRRYPDKNSSPFKINIGMASSSVVHKATGGGIYILPPNGESFRGDAYDMAIIDEAQEVEAGDESEDLVQGILPTFDTRTINGKPAGQLVLIGTAGEFQGGLFWDNLELGRQGKAGIVEYAADPVLRIWEDASDGPVEGSSADPEVWTAAHPGIGNLTPLAAVQRNHDSMTAKKFAQEYLGIWPTSGKGSLIPAATWDACALDTFPPMPSSFGMAVAVHFNQSSASIVAAWRDENGVAYLEIIEQKPGLKWVAEKLKAVARKHRVDITYDGTNNGALSVVEALNRAKPRPNLNPMSWNQVSTAAATLISEIKGTNLKHSRQPGLDAAAAIVTKRGTPNSSKWSLGRGKNDEDDITPLEAGMLALSAFDSKPAKKPIRIIT